MGCKVRKVEMDLEIQDERTVVPKVIVKGYK